MKSVTISPEVADVLSRATVQVSAQHHDAVILPAGQLARPLYEAVDKVLKALGGKWNKSVRGHVFANGLGEQLTEALEAGHAVDRKKSLEIFETPPPLAARMFDIVMQAAYNRHKDKPSWSRILEPSAGTGRLLAPIRDSLYTSAVEVVAIDIDASNCERLRQQSIATAVLCGDFLSMAPALDPFDVILMNPPFSRNQDIAHVNAAIDLLAPGGMLVAIMSAHWTFAEDQPSRDFRARTRIDGLPQFSLGVTTYPRTEIAEARVGHLPAGTFAESGTNVRSVLVTIRKEA